MLRRNLGWVLVFGIACADTEVGTASQAASVPGSSGGGGRRPPVDLEGTADLWVRADMTASQWVVRSEPFTADACSAVEGGIVAGEHRVLRFTVGVANIGDADLFIGDPNEHFTPSGDDGLFEFATCHAHFHFRHYVQYELLGADGRVWRAAKRGFCMLDTDPNPAWLGQPPRAKVFDSCGSPGTPGFQGISHGWTDTYRFFLGGQFFVLDGGDGQPQVPAGSYTLRITANPPFTPTPGELCPHRDPAGFCHMLPESDYDNNVFQTALVVPDHVGRTGVGPAAGLASPGAAGSHER